MSLRIQRRISLGSGLGLNVSKSGLSLSQRTPFGSIGTTGYSVRTGIPGVFFRKYRGRSRNNNTFWIIMLVLLAAGLFYLLFNVLKVVILYSLHGLAWTYKSLRQSYKNRLLKKQLLEYGEDESVDFVKFDTELLPDALKNKKLVFGKPFVKSGKFVSPELPLVTINSEDDCVILYAERPGVVTFFKYQGVQVHNGDYLYKITEQAE